jgi:aspartate carbamoyltransferase catalytic subunit
MREKFKGRDVLSIKEFSKEEILLVLEEARIQREACKPTLAGRLIGSCFFEPSPRTRLSFESAIKRLGGNVIGFSESQATSLRKGESLYDTIKVIGQYVDLLVIRHPLEGSARHAAEATEKPVINGGDGANEHPTQTLLDLYSILECQGTLENLNIVFVGDLKYGRTVHSLTYALKHFNVRLFFVAPQLLTLPQQVNSELRAWGIPFSFHQTIEEVIEKADILYMTRIQEERFVDKFEYDQLKYSFTLTPEILAKGKQNLKILHPLPRVHEISPSVDHTPQAYYFKQAENGLYVRKALLSLILQ